jgi:hypothetical protein
MTKLKKAMRMIINRVIHNRIPKNNHMRINIVKVTYNHTNNSTLIMRSQN